MLLSPPWIQTKIKQTKKNQINLSFDYFYVLIQEIKVYEKSRLFEKGRKVQQKFSTTVLLRFETENTKETTTKKTKK
eukprot:gene5934-4244_t